MHAFTALVLALAGSTLAAPTAEERAAAPKFRLSVAGSKDLNGWAVLEAHVAAGTNAIEIQRPAAFQSEVVSFVGDNGKAQIKSSEFLDPHRISLQGGYTDTLRSDKAGGSTFAYALPSVSNGQIKQVFAQLGAGTNSFGLNGNNRVTANGDAHGAYMLSEPFFGGQLEC